MWLINSPDKFVHIVTAHDPALYVPFFKSQVVAATIDGVIYVAKDARGALIGAAVWFGPGQEMFARWAPLLSVSALCLIFFWFSLAFYLARGRRKRPGSRLRICSALNWSNGGMMW